MTTYKEIFGKPIKVLTGDPAPTPITYTVTVANPGSGNVYYIDGVQTPTLELYEGNTYNFDYSAATGHPFRFATAADAAGSTEYTTGVSVDSNITTIVVASGAPNLFYYCTNHNGMGGRALTPASPDEYTGQIWYNETTGKFRSVVAGGAWSSDSSLVTARQATSAAGTMSAMFAAGGGYSPAVATNEEYNGSGWSSAEALPAGRAGGGQAFGTQTAGVYFGGTSADPATFHNDSYEYDGTNWTGGGAYPTPVTNLGSSGTLTAGLGFGGDPGSKSTTAEYNGTSWTAGGSLNTGRAGVAFSSAGTQTASLCAGGYNNPPGPRTNVEAYNGTAWTEVNDLPVARSSTTGAGTETNTIVIGGEISTGITNTCVQYDGTNWAAIPSMATPRFQTGTAGPGTSALAISGWGPGLRPTNEQYNFTANTVTAGAFASGGNLNTARYGLGGAGTQTAALAIGGEGPPEAKNEEYNGTSWTAGGTLNTGRYYLGGAGTQTSGLAMSGRYPPAGWALTNTEKYDGSSWTNSTASPTALNQVTTTGTQTASLLWGGVPSPGASNVTTTYEFDGSSWGTGGALPSGVKGAGAFGTQTAAMSAGNEDGDTLYYDGSSWSDQSSDIFYSGPTYRNYRGTMGTQTAGVIAGGGNYETTSAIWNGSVWSTNPSLATGGAVGAMGPIGTATSGLVCGGQGAPPSYTNINATEEFNGETTALNYKNISSS